MASCGWTGNVIGPLQSVIEMSHGFLGFIFCCMMNIKEQTYFYLNLFGKMFFRKFFLRLVGITAGHWSTFVVSHIAFLIWSGIKWSQGDSYGSVKKTWLHWKYCGLLTTGKLKTNVGIAFSSTDAVTSPLMPCVVNAFKFQKRLKF